MTPISPIAPASTLNISRQPQETAAEAWGQSDTLKRPSVSKAMAIPAGHRVGNHGVTTALAAPPISREISPLRLPVAQEFIPAFVCTSKVVWSMTSRRGLEPLTPGLGNNEIVLFMNSAAQV
jgi:hypothetical protein